MYHYPSRCAAGMLFSVAARSTSIGCAAAITSDDGSVTVGLRNVPGRRVQQEVSTALNPRLAGWS
jgi:hypothetical protein